MATKVKTHRQLTEREEKRLLDEYRVNVDLWKHDDLIRQSRTGNFLNVNTILLVALSAIFGIGQSISGIAIPSILFSVFGLAICWIWRAVLVRNFAFVLFRRFQLRSIEARLPGLTTFSNVYKAFYENKEVLFNGLEEKFIASKDAQASSTLLENRLPVIIAGLWTVVFILGMIALILGSFPTN